MAGNQSRPLKRTRTGDTAGMMPPQFPPAPGLSQASHAQWPPRPQPLPLPPYYIQQAAPALHSHWFRQSSPSPSYSNPTAPAVQAQAMHGQGFPPQCRNPPAPALQAQAIHAQGFQPQQHAQGFLQPRHHAQGLQPRHQAQGLQPQQHAQGLPSGLSFSVGSQSVPAHFSGVAQPQFSKAATVPSFTVGSHSASAQFSGAVQPQFSFSQVFLPFAQIPAGQGQGIDVKVPKSKSRLITGKHKRRINWMQSKSGTNIKMLDSVATATEDIFRITGQAQCVAMAKQMMETAILKGKFSIDLGHLGSPPKRVSGHAYKLPEAGTSQPP